MKIAGKSSSLTDVVFGVVGVLFLLLIAVWIGVRVFETKPRPDQLTGKVVVTGKSSLSVEYCWEVDAPRIPELFHPAKRRTSNDEEFLVFDRIDGTEEWGIQLTPRFTILTGNSLVDCAPRTTKGTAKEEEIEAYRTFFERYRDFKRSPDDKQLAILTADCRALLEPPATSLPDRVARFQDAFLTDVFEYLRYRLACVLHDLEPSDENEQRIESAVSLATDSLSKALIEIDEVARTVPSHQALLQHPIWRKAEEDAMKIDEQVIRDAVAVELQHSQISDYRHLCAEYVCCRAAREHKGQEFATNVDPEIIKLLLESGNQDPLLQILRIETETVYSKKNQMTISISVRVGTTDEIRCEQTREITVRDSDVKARVATVLFAKDKEPQVQFHWTQ